MLALKNQNWHLKHLKTKILANFAFEITEIIKFLTLKTKILTIFDPENNEKTKTLT